MGIDPGTVATSLVSPPPGGAWVGVPFMSRYSFWAVTVKRMIEAGEFGWISHIFPRDPSDDAPLCRVDSPWMADKSLAGGGALLNLGGHGFDMARFIRRGIAGRLCRGRPEVHGGEVEVYALATLRTPSGILLTTKSVTVPTWPANQTDRERKWPAKSCCCGKPQMVCS